MQQQCDSIKDDWKSEDKFMNNVCKSPVMRLKCTAREQKCDSGSNSLIFVQVETFKQKQLKKKRKTTFL